MPGRQQVAGAVATGVGTVLGGVTAWDLFNHSPASHHYTHQHSPPRFTGEHQPSGPPPPSPTRSLFTPVSAAAPKVRAGHRVEGLPEFSHDDVAARDGRRPAADGTTPLWVTYRGGVYDVTEFAAAHPGGEKRLRLAAGAPIDAFWRQYQIHDNDDVRVILERHRIGNLKGYDFAGEAAASAKALKEAAAQWNQEPRRHPALRRLSEKPFNAETPPAAIAGAPVTDNELFFVRNHMPVPAADDGFTLSVGGEGLPAVSFTPDELRRRFPRRTVTTTIQCGGNRRTDAREAAADDPSAEVKGLAWTAGAAGTAEWAGVWLRDIIAAAEGSALADSGPRVAGTPEPPYHVRLQGADRDAAGPFEVSIPLGMALDPSRDVLVAYEMNGAPIPRDHGHPLRAVVPGTVGVRNCKWLEKVTVAKTESESDWQQRDYKSFPPWLRSPDSSCPSVYDTPVTSAITDIERDGDVVKVQGYAYCGGGRGVQRVEVSRDGGVSFGGAAPLSDGGIEQPAGKRWAWQLFETELQLTGAQGAEARERSDAFVPICVRAVSSTNDVQPQKAAYNFRGLLYNGYSCATV